MLDNSHLDFKNLDYHWIYQRRIALTKAVNNMTDNQFASLMKYYANNWASFINDFGMTFDPRNIEKGLPARVPFILMPRQIEVVNSIYEHWKDQKDLLIEKSRAIGISWLAVGAACTACLFNPGMTAGFGSRKEEYVDDKDNLNSLLQKARMFLSLLPARFLQGMNLKRDCPFMLLKFTNNSQMFGETGDNIGRGARASIYFIDEAAFLERPQKAESALSATTNCRIYMSTVNGMGNVFAQKRHSGKIDVFTFHWRDNLLVDQDWYDNLCNKFAPHIIAQEYDINYSASNQWALIPSHWVQAAIDAHIKLGIEPEGMLYGALDVADTGDDKNAFAHRHGFLLQYLDEWTGKDSDIGHTTRKAFNYCDDAGVKNLIYDADGLGTGVRGFARIYNEERAHHNQMELKAFNGSGRVFMPDSIQVGDKPNRDTFVNKKAQMWWHLRTLFQNTFKAVNGELYNKDEIISISSNLKALPALSLELTQPTYTLSTTGKILVDKTPEGVKSPNLADAVMMLYSKVFVDVILDF